MATKTLNVNSEYFSLGGKKQTKKNRSSTPKMDLKPIITANSLKHKLLNRIKEHKNKEIKSLEKGKDGRDRKEGKVAKDSNNKTNITNTNTNLLNLKEYDNSSDSNATRGEIDEFEESLSYLKNLSEQRKKNLTDKSTNMNTYNKTIKHRENRQRDEIVPFVELDLPDSLKEPFQNTNRTTNTNINSTPVQKKLSFQTHNTTYKQTPTISTNIITKPNYNVDNQVPYGVLKGGIKPTYRQWNKTIKVNRPTSTYLDGYNSNSNSNFNPTTSYNPNATLSQNSLSVPVTMVSSSTYSKQPTSVVPLKQVVEPKKPIINEQSQIKIEPFKEKKETQEGQIQQLQTQQQLQPLQKQIQPQHQEPQTKKTKRTIKSRYTLGKSKKNNTVSILLKNKNTRKNILDAQKELKRKPIHDIKKYLLSHNLIKIGSNAPNDVIRKIYESSMLSGEIVNHNDETLLHNLMKDTEGNNE
jgi:hypothetical protein